MGRACHALMQDLQDKWIRERERERERERDAEKAMVVAASWPKCGWMCSEWGIMGQQFQHGYPHLLLLVLVKINADPPLLHCCEALPFSNYFPFFAFYFQV